MIDIAGTTYYYLFGPILVLILLLPLLLIVLAVFNRLFFRKRFSFWGRFQATVVILVVATVWMHWDVYQIGQQAKKICEEEGGLHVYKTVDVDGFKGAYSIESWSKYGYKYVEAGHKDKKILYSMEDGKVIEQVVDAFISNYEVAHKSIVINKHLKRSRSFVRDRSSGEVLGELVYFSIYPGWVDSQIWGRIGFTFTPWFCGQESSTGVKRRLGSYDVVRATLKPRNVHKLSTRMEKQPASSGQYKLLEGKGVKVCEAYEVNLNSFKPKVPMPCGRKVNPDLGFTKPEWSSYQGKLTPSGRPIQAFRNEMTALLWERDVNPVKYYRVDKWLEWQATTPQVEEAYRTYLDDRQRFGHLPFLSEFDIDNDGKIEPVYFEQPCGSVYGSLLAVLSTNYDHIDMKKTELIMPHPPFNKKGSAVFRPVKKGDWGISPSDLKRGYTALEDAIHDVDYDVFLYGDEAYIDQWWKNHPDFIGKSPIVAGKLRVYQLTSSGINQVCSFKFLQ